MEKNMATNSAFVGPFRSRKGLLLGVLRGLGDHFGISTLLLRLVVVAVSVLLTFWPMILAYIIAAVCLPTERKYELS
jgi:phage shock protein C